MKKLEVNLLVAMVAITALFFSGCESKKDKLSVYPDELEFYVDDEDEIFVEVSSNAKWSASTSAKWIYIDESTDGFYVSVDPNPGASRERTGKITVKAGEASSATITVTQLTTSSPGGGGGSGSLKFSDIVKSNFSATGTPGFAAVTGPTTWTGQLTPSSGADQFYEFNCWGGKTVNLWCDFVNGKIVIDRDSQVAKDGTNLGYFRAVALDNAKKEYYMVTEAYYVNYNKTNRTLDFSGTYKGFPVYVGVPALGSSSSIEITGVFTELYANAKLVLTPSSSSLKNVNDAAKSTGNFSWSDSINFEELKNYKLKQ